MAKCLWIDCFRGTQAISMGILRANMQVPIVCNFTLEGCDLLGGISSQEYCLILIFLRLLADISNISTMYEQLYQSHSFPAIRKM